MATISNLSYASRKFSCGFRPIETYLLFNPGDFQALEPSVMEFWDTPPRHKAFP